MAPVVLWLALPLLSGLRAEELCPPPEVHGLPEFHQAIVQVREIHFVEKDRLCKLRCRHGSWVGPTCSVLPSHNEPDGCLLSGLDPELIVSGVPHGATESLVARGTELHFRCPQTYRLAGESRVVCGADGVWSGPFPRCLQTTLQTNFSLLSPPTIVYNVAAGEAGTSDTGQLVVVPSSVVHLDCLYRRYDGNPEWTWTPSERQYPSGWAIGSEDRNWKYRLSVYSAREQDSGIFTCTTPRGFSNFLELVVREIHCPPILSVDHQRVMAVEGNQLHSRAKFACVDGYRLVGGPEEVTCTEAGRWSHPIPHCEAMTCPPMEPSPELIVKGEGNNVGTRLFFSCTPGSSLHGPSSVTCRSDGTWSGVLPNCRTVECPPPTQPEGGLMFSSSIFRSGDFVRFSCEPGRWLRGASVSVCQDDGTWSQPPPACEPMDCPPPTDTPTELPRPRYVQGEELTVTCPSGARARLRCGQEGQWIGACS